MESTTSIQSDLIVAKPLPADNGYTWTLASRLGNMLHLASELFGPRDVSYTLLGVEFCDGGPQIWYPGNCRHIVIQLSSSCLNNLPQACYQLAHECVHLLAPSGGRKANVLEEGLATHFSDVYVQNAFGITMAPTLTSYREARIQVRRLMAVDPAIVRRVRATQPSFHLITAADLVREHAEVPRALAESLVAPFVRETPSEERPAT